MGTIVILAMVGIPCVITLLWFLTPHGKHWLRQNNMI